MHPCYLLLPALLFILSSLPVQASNIWQPLPLKAGKASTVQADDIPGSVLTADQALLKALLWDAPDYATGQGGVQIDLPLPDGSFVVLEVFNDPILAADVAAQYPDIRTFRALGVNDSNISGRLDFTPTGFHAMLQTSSGVIFINPEAVYHTDAESNHYRTLQKPASREHTDFICATQEHEHVNELSTSFTAARALKQYSHTVKNYDLALSATRSYSQAVANGNISQTFAEMTTAINRVNDIFERDLGIRLTIKSDSRLISSSTLDSINGGNPLTDSLDKLLDRHQAWIDAKWPDGEYDIGHVFAAHLAGGLASIQSACSSYKAQGATSLPDPTGDYFYIEFVAHEFAHQFGATHTFNASGGEDANAGYCDDSSRHGPGTPGLNSQFFASYEPGSGSTIMSYAGSCDQQNLQNYSDHYFHGYSIEQARNFISTSYGSCGSGMLNGSDQNRPSADAGNDYTIPANTPFILRGSATDADPADTFTYSWEQMDLGPATTSKAQMNSDSGRGPLIRSRLPTTSRERAIPPLDAILESNLDKYDGERLPTTSRELNFTFTARSGNHGVAQDDMLITVSNKAGPFRITGNLSGSATGLAVLPISWNVANTDEAPVNCPNVNIDFSTDQGNTFTTLLENTANNGSARVVLPNTTTSTGRIRVLCSDNIFFDISRSNLALTSNNSISSVLSIHALDASQYEGKSGQVSFRFAVKRSGDTSSSLTVDYSTAGSGSNPADANDFASGLLPSDTISFASGQDTAIITMDVLADGIAEPAEQFTVTLEATNPPGHSMVIASADSTIMNGEKPAPSSSKKGGYTTLLLLALLLLAGGYRQQP